MVTMNLTKFRDDLIQEVRRGRLTVPEAEFEMLKHGIEITRDTYKRLGIAELEAFINYRRK